MRRKYSNKADSNITDNLLNLSGFDKSGNISGTAIKLLISILLVVHGNSLFAQELKVNVAKSTLKWTGKKVTGEHYGFINLKEGNLTLKNNKITGGTFIIDMNSLTNNDLTDAEWNQKLVGHLKSDDFFGVEKFPISTLVITESTPFKNGVSNVKAKLTIKGITHPITFEAKKDGNSYAALITVDRSQYDVRYGSGKFFDNLGDKTIYDEFTLEVKLVAL